ncbi:DUF4342 domain-containing protein [Gudongella sp. DL1XJH-153]|uniref:DUF4342 domain-containing protein n=1 Tax=Gudongella sp. DL1XJH-153 TaxID=3409804 RepID=UPI003BB6BE38
MVTLEQVEKLREYANISYEEAKVALEETDGDILEAIVNLEKRNRINRPEGGGTFNSNERQQESHEKSGGTTGNKTYTRPERSSFGQMIGKFFRSLGDIISKGNRNTFEVMQGQEKVMSIPVTVMAVLLLFTFWITIPLVILGMFFGYRYRIVGPDLGREDVNRAMDSVADAAENFKNEVKGDMKDGKNSDN